MPNPETESHASASNASVQHHYRYSFAVWPDETWTMDQAMFELFRMTGMFETAMTQSEFEAFRSGLSHHGLTLREITRIPDAQPESIL